MRSNRSIRIGIALMGGAFLLLILFFMWRFNRNSQQDASLAANAANNPPATQIAMRSDRLSAVAAMELPAHSIITEDSFKMEQMPEGMASTGNVIDKSMAIGFVTRVPIRNGDRIKSSQLIGHITQVGIAGALQPGMRAMVVPIPSKPTLHDLVRVGDTVDIIAAFDQQESRTIVEGVRVLAVDVFVKDYPQTSGAVRGPYKAPNALTRSDSSLAPAPAQQQPSTPAAAQPGQPAPTPTPTPTPAPTAALAPAFTLEVTPDQANRISLAQNSGAAIDFIIVPPTTGTPIIVPGNLGQEVRATYVTRAQLAPYAARMKNAGAGKAGSTPRAASSNTRGSRNVSTGGDYNGGDFTGPILPKDIGTGVTQIPPAAFSTSKPTYEIPVFADSKPIRTDVVLKPKAYSSEADSGY